jgi:hypothetical protein
MRRGETMQTEIVSNEVGEQLWRGAYPWGRLLKPNDVFTREDTNYRVLSVTYTMDASRSEAAMVVRETSHQKQKPPGFPEGFAARR